MSFYKAIKSLLQLAIPTIIGNIGIILTVVVDTVMVAQFDTNELTYRSAANIIHFFVITMIAGFTQGIGIASANFFGKANYTACGNIITKNTLILFLIGILGTIIYWYGGNILLLLKQNAIVASNADPVLKILGIGFIPCVFYFSFAYFLESIKKPIPVMVVVIIVNVLNIVLNWILIFGNLGVPALGAIGSAIATVIVEFLAVILLLLYIVFMKHRKKFFNKALASCSKEKSGVIFIGFSIALILGAEELGYAANLTFAGWISNHSLASYALVMNIFMVSLTIAMGLAEATGILVGIHNGKKDPKGMYLITVTSLILNLVIMLVISSTLYIGASFIPGLYSNDIKIIATVYPLLHFLAFIVIIDSSQVIISNAIRGTKIVVIPSTIQIISSIGIMIPLSWFFALYLNMAVNGLLLGILISSSVSLILLGTAFYFIMNYKKQRSKFV